MIRIPLPANTSSNTEVNLLSRSRIKNLNWPARWPRSIRRLRACWAGPRPGGVRGDTQDMHPPGADLHHEEHVQAPEERSVNVQEVTGQPGRGQDPPDRSRADPVSEAEELTLDATVPPPRVLPGQSPDQLPDLLRNRRAPGGFRIGPLVLDQAPVPGEQGAGCHDPVQPQVGGQQPRQRGDHRTVSPVRLRAGDLAAKDRDLVPQDQDLHLLGGAAAREQYQPGEHPDHEQIEDANEHERRG
jgi:hypothetical protein